MLNKTFFGAYYLKFSNVCRFWPTSTDFAEAVLPPTKILRWQRCLDDISVVNFELVYPFPIRNNSSKKSFFIQFCEKRFLDSLFSI